MPRLLVGAAILNNNVFNQLKVRYSTQRKRPDQSPSESIEQGVASAPDLAWFSSMHVGPWGSLLVCGYSTVVKPIGQPQLGGSFDDSWHFWTCEATGKDLNKGWFVNRPRLPSGIIQFMPSMQPLINGLPSLPNGLGRVLDTSMQLMSPIDTLSKEELPEA